MKKQITENRFTSPLLKSLPQIRKWGNQLKVTPRVTLLGLMVFILVLMITITLNKVLPTNSFWFPIYWLHDAVYLPIKGYTWIWPYPWGTTWYALIAIVIILVTISFVGDRSLILAPQVSLLRWMTNQPFAHPLLLRFARWFTNLRLPSKLLRMTIEQERSRHILTIITEKDVNIRLQHLWPLAKITNLHIKVEVLFSETISFQLAKTWEESYLTLLIGSEDSASLAIKNEGQQARRELLSTFPLLFSGNIVPNKYWKTNEPAKQILYSQPILLGDLARLIIGSMDDNQAKRNMGDWFDEADQATAQQLQTTSARIVDQRRFFLEEALNFMQSSSTSQFVNGSSQESAVKSRRGRNLKLTQSPKIDMSDVLIAFRTTTIECFEFSALIAFHLAFLDRNYERGLAYYESLDAYILMLNLMRELSGENQPDTLQLPSRVHFPPLILSRTAAHFQSSIINTQEKLLQMFEKDAGGIVTIHDLELFRQKKYLLRQTAGPVHPDETTSLRGK